MRPFPTAGQYDRFPAIRLEDRHVVLHGVEAWHELRDHALTRVEPGTTPVIAIDAYPGVDLPALLARIEAALPEALVLDVECEAARSPEELDALLARNLTDDRVFGVLSHHLLAEFYRPEALAHLARRIEAAPGLVVLVGLGATLVPAPQHTVVLADLARWEIQLRLRAGATNWRADNSGDDVLRKFKRGYFVDWRVADRHKRTLFDAVDFVLDSTSVERDVKLLTGDAFRSGLAAAAARPFRVVPFFDPGVWGGQWMREVFGLDEAPDNYAWCFDCVPEENSLLLDVGGDIVELPAMDLVLQHPVELLGERTHARFGAEFPIRFDFLDTMAGGNLSLQVHPLTDYIQSAFGMHYTQDESYYLLDAAEDATVYLGTRTGVDREEMTADLRRAATGEIDFPAEKYINAFPAKPHDHFLIPAGTVHCSGADSMVLEISATPYIFTFKMWDWGRVGLDGSPRPIHLGHALANIQWDRDTEWTRANLVNRVERVAEGECWVEERTGLHELEFIEVRRHWFTGPVPHDTEGTLQVLNLVSGSEAVVESPTGAFAPFVVHYAETFIVPAAVGAFSLRPTERSAGERLGTVKAFVRGTRHTDE
ncbi:mannose-6-phosphate isomerase class I [Rathayibacter sp. PhB93]|uniref:class I mannose-6-phosphate isomerase n=1 Tax=unclassified Rathayibacter TaxID=2609250 RepID=UPI000F48B77C|nr:MULTISPECIES: class I mannose-6-phosphate isomerase [unclassified Rathayibacter]ROQ04554.1 mannose-6-phosphate isomerase class I [Rathayibacter sp. PhB93]TDQ13392.1 mannose-6-phosphate isomerase class I [Rathayibacter sp. PhB1]